MIPRLKFVPPSLDGPVGRGDRFEQSLTTLPHLLLEASKWVGEADQTKPNDQSAKGQEVP